MPARRRRQRLPGNDSQRGAGFAAELARQHLLLVPDAVEPQLVAQLVRDRHPTSELQEAGVLSLGRHSRLTGPFDLSLEDAVVAGVPLPWSLCYCLEAPVEREAPPLPGTDDRDGFAFAFPDGLPWRDEARALHLLVSLARRIGGAVRTAGSLELIQPDPGRAVDHVVHAPRWLTPEEVLGVVRRDLPGARLAVDAHDWAGPPDAAYTGELVLADIAENPLNAAQLEALHARADTMDIEVLNGPVVIDAFAIVADMGADGLIEVRTHLSDGAVPAVAHEPWAGDDFVTYEVCWLTTDPAERERRVPTQALRVGRSRVGPLIAGTARAIAAATRGVLLDEDGFRVDGR